MAIAILQIAKELEIQWDEILKRFELNTVIFGLSKNLPQATKLNKV